MSTVLSGERVLDFCWVGAGALVTQTLALHGADVIKIESTARPDNLRVAPPFRPGQRSLNGSGYFASRNSAKRSFALNMKHPEAKAVARELAEASSVLTSNFRPGVLERWGLGYGDLSATLPQLIHLSMPMQGSHGPHRDFIGFGSTIAALAGLVAPSGLPDRKPIGTGTHYPDHLPNPGHALVALLGALYRRDRTGVGAEIELSQFESTVNMVGPDIVAASVTGSSPGPHGNRVGHAVPHGVFPCREADSWCAIAVEDDGSWHSVADVLGSDLLCLDSRFQTVEGRRRHEADLEREIAAATRRWSARQLAQALQDKGVAAAEVATTDVLLTDPHLAARRYWRHLEHPEMGEIVVPGLPFSLDRDPVQDERAAPLLGEHTWEIAETVLGMGRSEFERNVEKGLFA